MKPILYTKEYVHRLISSQNPNTRQQLKASDALAVAQRQSQYALQAMDLSQLSYYHQDFVLIATSGGQFLCALASLILNVTTEVATVKCLKNHIGLCPIQPSGPVKATKHVQHRDVLHKVP